MTASEIASYAILGTMFVVVLGMLIWHDIKTCSKGSRGK